MRSDGCRVPGTLLRWCSVVGLLVAAIGVGLAPVHPQAAGSGAVGGAGDKAIKATDLRGEWIRAGAGFACKVGAVAKLPPELLKPEILARACLHMGPFVVGDDAQALVTALGAPHRTLPQPNGVVASIYFLEKAGQYPYLVATLAKNRIVALQVTGPVPAKGYGFNHVDLGVSTDALVQVFGQPKHLEPSSEKDTDLWTYGPWPFSFEVKADHVTSIRINEPN
jgi:hypothetical protein